MLSAFKNFLITFLIAALIFGSIGYFTTKYVSGVVKGILDGEKDKLEGVINDPANTTPQDDRPEDPEKNEKEPDGNSFTALFVGTDFNSEKYDNYFTSDDFLSGIVKETDKDEDTVGALQTRLRFASATWIVLVRADKEAREFALCYFTPETRITTPTGEVTLGEVYSRYGMDVVCEYLNTMTGLDINYRFVVDDEKLNACIEKTGAVEFDLGCDIFSAGKYHVSADNSADLDPAVTDKPIVEPPEHTTEKKPDPEPDDTDDEDTDESEKDSEESETDPSEPPDDPDPVEPDEEITTPEPTEPLPNVKVLGKGIQTLSDYSASILNTFKEFSSDDINVKSAYMLEIIKQYLVKFSEMSDEEAFYVFNSITGGVIYDFADPYSDKPILGTDMPPEMLSNVHSMLEALEYFSYTQFTYPGSYSEETNFFSADVKAGHDLFEKYGKVNENK